MQKLLSLYKKIANYNVIIFCSLFLIIFTLLFIGYFPVTFSLNLEVSIEHEDGSGQSFNLKGHLEIEVYLEHHTVPSWRPRRFEAYYNTKTRKGHICFD